MNSFYRDKAEGDFEVSGEYCCLGYFDALNVERIGTFENEVVGNMREKVYDQIIKTVDGKCSQKNIICVTENEQQDAEFWEKKEQMPYLFVTMMHVQQDKNDSMDQAKAFAEHGGNEQKSFAEAESKKEKSLVECVNERDDSIAYYTYDHCEVVIAHYDKSYDKGVEFIFKYLEDKSVYKLYSTFCILQTLVENKDELVKVTDRENVDCLLRVSLKDFEKYEMFLEELKKKFSKQKEDNKSNTESSEMLENNTVASAELSEREDEEIVTSAESSEENKSEVWKDGFKTLESKTAVCVETPDVLDNEEKECVVAHKVLGSKDIVIELRDVPIEELIECYAINNENKNLLNHNNRFYKSAFFNIETEILKARRREKPNECADT